MEEALDLSSDRILNNNNKYCYIRVLYCVSLVNETYNDHKVINLNINEYLATRCIIQPTQGTVFRLACYVTVRRVKVKFSP